MHSLFGKRGVLLAGLLVTALAAMTPSSAAAKPEPGATKPRGFRLFARSLGAITINRIYCGLATTGEVCVDSTNSSTIGGGYWPKGTADQYVFNSGLQLAGRIGGSKPANPWGGDTTGAFFFDPKGTTQHGQEVQPIYNATNPDDFNNWPAAAMVPQGDANEEIFYPLLRGLRSASQGDIWFMSWEGNPSQNAQRLHPLGVLVETRGMGWNFPKGNEDILYFVYTFYNITSLNPADYASVRPALQPILLQQAQQFQSANEAAFGVSLPDGGWPIENLFAAFAADMDVADAGTNFASVNLPFALGHTYDAAFSQPAGWTFDPGIFSAPFFNGAGFVGVKYLKSPTGAGEIQLFSNTINGAPFAGAVNDPGNAKQLFRYLSGTLSPATGDQPCNTGNPSVSRICFINNNSPRDMRFFQSSTPLTVGPGQFGSIVVAYIFAPPVAIGSYTPGTNLFPGDATLTTNVAAMTSTGLNKIDSITGFRGYSDGNGDGIAQQSEFQVVDGSLLGKANVAQAVFDNKFLLPFAPESPEFYLVPGDNEVTVLWKPSASETTGDPYFVVASSATVTPPGGGAPVANALYDPNYRQFDVEGYRIYRGRVDAPNSLTLLAQFDYAGTEILDFSGFINPTSECAPELVPAIVTNCPVGYIPAEFQPGVTRTVFNAIPLVGPLVQIQPGGRTALADGTAFVLKADTTVTGSVSGNFPELADTGVPFVYVDETVRNNFRYFYSVTAFDVNSLRSGLTNLESPRITKSVTPTASASNFLSEGELSFGIFGDDGVELDASTVTFTIDPETGRFNGPPPPTTAISAVFAPLIPRLLPAINLTATIDSVRTRTDEDFLCQTSNIQGMCFQFFVTFSKDGEELEFSPNVNWPISSVGLGEADFNDVALGSFPIALDPNANQRYGLPAGLRTANAGVGARLQQYILFSAHENQYGRRYGNRSATFGTGTTLFSEGGSRWFEGANETIDDPTYSIRVGHLTGVDTIYAPLSHMDQNPAVTGVQAPVNSTLMQCSPYHNAAHGRQADIEVTWGAGGTLASVRDITHHLDVPFKDIPQGSYGFLTDNNGNGKIDWNDMDYVEGVHQAIVHLGFCALTTLLPPASRARLTQTASLTNVSTMTDPPGTFNPANFATTGQGFGFYINGQQFIFQMAALPAAGTKWTLRSYAGQVRVATGLGTTDPGGYSFQQRIGSPAIPGLQVKFNFSEGTQVVASTAASLDQVHTVPDPYYVTNEFEQTTDTKIIKFVNLPQAATIRIYSSSGVLVTAIEHNSAQSGGTADWNVRNRNNQVVASGVYFYHIESGDARRVGRFTIVNFAQ